MPNAKPPCSFPAPQGLHQVYGTKPQLCGTELGWVYGAECWGDA